MAGKSWKVICAEKQAERARLVDEALTAKSDPEHATYLKATASEIVRNIQEGKAGWTAENVMKAYIYRAAQAQKQINCVTEVLFTQALNEAKILDAEFAETKQIRGPLHGVPVSLKDLLEVKGFDACIGFSQWAQKPCEQDAEIVKQIRAVGGIPFVKTNVPQTMLAFECSNPVWGRTLNPYSDLHTCGGSSGGEAALVACDGSALGIGNDVGGSLRIPTSFSGAYSLKPSFGRITSFGGRGCVPGFEGIRTCTGPITRSVEDVELACRTLFGKSNALTESLAPVPYREVSVPKKLKFGYYKSDELIKHSPPVQRAVQETVDALKKEGHECVEFVVPNMVEMARVFVALTSADKYATLTSHMGPDPKDPALQLVTLGPKLPGFVRALVAWAAQKVLGDEIFCTLFRSSRARTVGEFWAETKARNEYNQLFYKEVWEKYEFDGIICPVNAMPSIPHGATADLSPLAFATALYNIVDSPAGIIPVTRVDKEKDVLTPEWRSTGVTGSPFIFKKAYEGKDPRYNPESMHGIPVGVQVVGKHWDDEKVIEMMKIVDSALGKRDFGPGAWSPKESSS